MKKTEKTAGKKQDLVFDLDVEAPSQHTRAAVAPGAVAVREASDPLVMQVLPKDFPLQTLLMFVPDVAIKASIEQACFDARKIDVSAHDGPMKLEAAIVKIRDAMKFAADCFKEPVELANRLHKRLTGLRADFLAQGETSVKQLGHILLGETQRREREAEAKRRVLQEEADRLAREEAQRVAREAKASGAPAAVVKTLKEQAKQAVGAPVSSYDMPQLDRSSEAKRWKARLIGTADDASLNPETQDLVEAQEHAMRLLVRAVADGKQPLTLLQIDWKVANARATSDRKAMNIPGLEAVEVSSLRFGRR